jgi:hypothetical protein
MRASGRRGMSAVLTAVTVLALLTLGSFQAAAAPSFYDPPSPRKLSSM